MQRATSVLCPLVVVCAVIAGCSSATEPSATATASASSPVSPSTGSTATAILPTLSKPTSCAQGLDDAGTAVGESEGSDFNLHAVQWTGGTITRVGDLGGHTSTAYAISYRGVIVGSSINGAGNIHGFADATPSQATDLGDLGGGFSSALGVNNWGVVVGSSTDGASVSRAFLWTPTGGIVPLTASSQDCGAFGINDWGQVVGDCTNASGTTTAFVQTLGPAFSAPRGLRMQTLPGLGGTFSVAWGVSELGEIVGESATPDGIHHAVRWNGIGHAVQLPALASGQPSFAYAVNTEGTVAGAAADASGTLHAVQWSPFGTLTDLGTAGEVSSIAYGIDSRGGVVGCAYDNEGNSVAVWWGNGAPASSATVVAMAPVSAGQTAAAQPYDYAYGPSASLIRRLGIHAASPEAMRALRFGHTE